MGDGLKRTLAAIIGCAGIAYIAWMLSQHQIFVQDSMIANQTIIGVGLMLLYFVFVFGLALRPLAMKRLKWYVAAYGILLLFLGHYLLISKADQGIYAGDIVTVSGVLIFFLSVSGALITKKVKKQIEHAMQEIIEV